MFWDVATFPGVVVQCRAFALIKVEQSVPDGTHARRRNDRHREARMENVPANEDGAPAETITPGGGVNPREVMPKRFR